MPTLADVQKLVPGAYTAGGKVNAYHRGKHLTLGKYAGEDIVILSVDGERYIKSLQEEDVVEEPVTRRTGRRKKKVEEELPGSPADNFDGFVIPDLN